MTERAILFVILWIGLIGKTQSQGVSSEFGQNRVQFRDFQWQKLTYDNIDIVYYDSEDVLARQAIETAVIELKRIENFLSYKYGGAMQIAVFRNLTEYRQSNIGYENPQHSAGGFLVIPKDVSTVYFTGDYHNLQIQLRRAICDIILTEMIYGGTLQDRFSNVRSPQLPSWFIDGLSAFLAESWSAEDENSFLNALSSNSFANFNNLNHEESILAGKSIWRYLVEEYGPESVGTIMFIARYTHSAEAAIYFHTQKNIGRFLHDWKSFYEQDFARQNGGLLPKGVANIPLKIARRTHTDVALSPDGKKVAIVTNELGKYNIWEYNFASQTVKHLYSGGQRVLNQIHDYGFPKIQWNPVTGNLTYLSYEGGEYVIREQVESGNKVLQRFTSFSGIVNFSFSRTGDSLLLCATRNGSPDLYLMNLKNLEITQLTFDIYSEMEAIFDENGLIYFTSNRPIQKDSAVNFDNAVYNVFKYNNGESQNITRYFQPIKIHSLIAYEAGIIGFLSNYSGLYSAWVYSADSNAVYGQTNYKLGIIDQSISADHKTIAELLLINQQYHIFTSFVPENPIEETVIPANRNWKRSIGNIDSIFNDRNIIIGTDLSGSSDSIQISIIDSIGGNYKFQTGFDNIDYNQTSGMDTVMSVVNFKRGHFYNSLQPDYILSQSENRNLGSYMHNNEIRKDALRNPVIMPYFKISLSDVLKNYIIETGFRTSLDLLITDYISHFALLKNRADHEFTIGRHSRKYEDGNNNLKQNISTQLQYSYSYPFNEKNRISVSPGVRQELFTMKATEKNSLNTPDIRKNFVSIKIDFVHDNTISLGLNMLSGFRFTTGLDVIKSTAQLPPIINYRLDARLYKPIWRKIIWANRLSGVYGMGKGKVAYYMGAVENWTAKTQFEPNTENLKTENNYYFQQWVSQLRGFNRGVRMGSSFVLLNSEIRIPLIQMLVNRSLASEFFKNFTITGFGDLGTAFIGNSPGDPNNPFNTVYKYSPNYDISITSQRNPWALGVGYGVRTRFLGYFVKFDHAWGYLENQWFSPLTYFSLGFDF